MGVVGSKSPLERRNTVLRRSQRKSIHGIKGKTDKIAKEIRKFKGVEEDTAYVELKAKIEGLERELKHAEKNLQPQLRNIHSDALRRIDDCWKLLQDKLTENQEKLKEKQAKESSAEKKEEEIVDDVFVEETDEQKEEEKRRTVELKLVQVEMLENSPQLSTRSSIAKYGVPVMPGSIMEAMHRKTHDLEINVEAKVAKIRQEIEQIEIEISNFVGRKDGKYYNKIKRQLEDFRNDLDGLPSVDDAINEQVKLCHNYVGSCLSFLDEKAMVDGSSSEEEEEEEEVPVQVPTSNLSPKAFKTTFI